MDAGAIILAGGKSSRMGTNKALLTFNGTTNIERIVKRLGSSFPDPLLVTNDPETYRFLGLQMTSDLYPGKGPLAGIHAGLSASQHEVNVIAACDMPFISADLACRLVHMIGAYDAVVPVIFGKQHPLFSVMKKKAANTVEESIKDDRLRMKQLLDKLNVLYVTERELAAFESLERIFFNMNHPDEYEIAKKWAGEEEAGRNDEVFQGKNGGRNLSAD